MNQSTSIVPATYEAPPPYAASSSDTSSSLHSLELPPSLSPPFEQPPEFSIFPLTLVLSPGSTLIHPSIGNRRALYQLSSPLSSTLRAAYLTEIPPTASLGRDGRLTSAEMQTALYKIHEAPELPRDPSHTGISAQRKDLFQGTILRRGWKGCTWGATSHGESWLAKGEVIFSAKQKGNDLEWRNQKGTTVAVEHRAVERGMEVESLELLAPLGKRPMDMIVAVWIARIFQDTRKDGVAEREVERRRKREERRLGAQNGRQRGLFRGSKCSMW